MSFNELEIKNSTSTPSNEIHLNEGSGVFQSPTAKTSLGNKILNRYPRVEPVVLRSLKATLQLHAELI